MSAQLECPSCESRFKVPADAITVAGRMVRCGNCKYEWNATRNDLIFPEADAILEQAEDLKPSSSDEPETTEEDSSEDDKAKTTEDNDITESEEDEIPITNTIAPDNIAQDEKKEEIAKAEAMAKKLAKKKQPKPKKIKKPRKKLSQQQFNKRLSISTALMGILFFATAFVSWHDGIRRTMPFTESIYSMFGYPTSDGVKLAGLKLSRINLNKRNRYIISGNIVNTSKEHREFPTLHIRLVDKEGKQLRALGGAEPRMLKPGETFSFSPSIDSLLSRTEHSILVEIGNGLELSERD